MNLASICLSRPFEYILSAIYLECFHDISKLCKTGRDDVSRIRMVTFVFILFQLFPLKCFFLAETCPRCKFNTLSNIFMIPYRHVKQFMKMCRERE